MTVATVAIEKEPILIDELQEIAAQKEGLLLVEDVIQWASDNPSSALYHHLEWSDSKAAHAYRIWQVRVLVGRVTICLVENNNEPIRAFVSLKADRQEPGGGYRLLVRVLADAEKRSLLLAQALEELQEWQAKYKQLYELADVFSTIERVRINNS